MDYLEKNPLANIRDIMMETGMSRSSINRSILKLKSTGLISRSGSKRDGEWTVRRRN
ncbi:MAG: MarR family transcriptional regulator [Methanomassiliicoccaceae archaeon]|nr:MarR family transcriptional regulator [Methanomassiliicoccaceae archaeon]